MQDQADPTLFIQFGATSYKDGKRETNSLIICVENHFYGQIITTEKKVLAGQIPATALSQRRQGKVGYFSAKKTSHFSAKKKLTIVWYNCLSARKFMWENL